MSGVKIVFNVPGFYELRSASGVVRDLRARAARVAAKAEEIDGGTYLAGSQQGEKRPQGRWRTSVVTADARTIAKNHKHKTLLRALDAGR